MRKQDIKVGGVYAYSSDQKIDTVIASHSSTGGRRAGTEGR